MRKRDVLAEFKKTVKSCLKHVEGYAFDEKDGNVKVVPYLQWLDYLRAAGYAEEDVMPYLAPDFVDEMLEERHFDRM